MSFLPAFAAVASLAAALAALVLPAGSAARAARILSVVAAVAMVPSLEEASSWPWAALVAGAALFATPLPCLFAAAAAATVALQATTPEPQALGAPVLAAMAFAAVAASLGSEGASWLRSGADRAWPAAFAGLALALAAAFVRAHDARAPIPGAGLLVGLAQVVTLAGSLALLAHLLTPETPSAPVRRFGQGALVLGAGLGMIAAGFVLFRVSRLPDVLTARAPSLVGLMLGAAGLVAALVVLIGPPPSGEALPWTRQAAFEARIGGVLAVAALGAAGLESWFRLGSYATPLTAASASTALLALSALEPTTLGLPRKALWLLALAFVVAT